jgi:hypothetical protein
MKTLLLFALLALSGCSTLTGQFENRLACSLANDELFIVSKYGPLGIASTISDKDRVVVCK